MTQPTPPTAPSITPIPINRRSCHLHYNTVGRLLRLTWRRDQRPKHRRTLVGAEVGVYRGHLSQRLLHCYPQLLLYCIDPWRAPLEHESYFQSRDPISRNSQDEYDGFYREVLGRTVEFGERAMIRRMTSLEAAWEIRTTLGVESLDFVFIDGDHSEPSVRNDLTAWWPLVRPGGLFSGHDYGWLARQAGVRRAVDAFAQSVGLAVKPGRGRVWYGWKAEQEKGRKR